MGYLAHGLDQKESKEVRAARTRRRKRRQAVASYLILPTVVALLVGAMTWGVKWWYSFRYPPLYFVKTIERGDVYLHAIRMYNFNEETIHNLIVRLCSETGILSQQSPPEISVETRGNCVQLLQKQLLPGEPIEVSFKTTQRAIDVKAWGNGKRAIAIPIELDRPARDRLLDWFIVVAIVLGARK